MKCPLMRIPITVQGATDRDKIDECIKEECAWWDKEDSQCCIIRIMAELYCLNVQLGEMKMKMLKAV